MDLGGPRSPLDLGTRRLGAAIGDVVIDRVVEQHGILRHHADGHVQAALGHRAHVLPVDPHRAAGDVIEPEQQPPDGGLARSRRPDQGHAFACRHPQRDPPQDLAFGVIGEIDMVKLDHPAAHLQRLCPRRVQHFGGLAQQAEHLPHVDQRLPDLAVDGAKEVQRQRDLDHIGVDHDEIADRQHLGLHPLCRHHHHRHQPGGDQRRLPCVQHRQAESGLDRRHLVPRHRPVIARRLARLGPEILDRLEVQEAVDGLLVGVGVLIVHLAPHLHPPLGDAKGIGDIEGDGDHHDRHVLPAEQRPEDHRDHRQFQDQRPDREQHEAQQEIDTLDAAFHNAAQAAGLAGDVIAHRQAVDVGERLQRQPSQRPLADPHKDRIAQFGEGHRPQPRHPIGQRQPDGPQHHHA